MIDKMSTYFSENAASIQEWLANKAEGHNLPFYSSADVRDSGFKSACVDLNLFPAGFNNLCGTFASQAAKPVQSYLEDRFSRRQYGYKNVVIIPEAHSRNPYYNKNILSLKQTLESAGLKVTIASLAEPGEPYPTELITFDNESVPVSIVRRENDRIVGENNEVFDWILLNNDLSSGSIEWLEDLEQPVVPPLCFGWHNRSKYQFFEYYTAYVKEMAEAFAFDPWMLYAMTDKLEGVNFVTDEGRQNVAASVEKMLESVGKKYREYGIDEEPHVFIKNDTGTYGIGIMVVKSPDEILKMNRKARNKMAIGKGRRPIRNVVIQEAVPTRSVTDDLVTEPVVYMIGKEVIGMFLRANAERGTIDNLNARGMEFYTYCSLNSVSNTEQCVCNDTIQQLYRTVSKLAVLASAREMEAACGGKDELPGAAAE
jgi:glutamate--cysteine ligase